MFIMLRRHPLAAPFLLATVLLSACATKPLLPSSALVGQWGQDEACGAGLNVRELEFSDNGRFSVTWRPFETYRDYWGSWSYDERTRALELVIDGGNNRPTDFIGRGRVTFSEGALDLGEISLGSAYGHPPCDLPFNKIERR